MGPEWKPSDIKNAAVLEKLLAQMRAAERGLRRLGSALDKTGAEPLTTILHSLKLPSLDQVNNLEILQKIVLALEAKTEMAPNIP